MCNSLVSNVIPEVSIGVSYIVDAPAAREAEPRVAARHVRRPRAGESPRLCGRRPLANVAGQTWFSLFSLFGFVSVLFLFLF